MFLNVTQARVSTPDGMEDQATIRVMTDDGQTCVADVMVEVYRGVPRLVITPAIEKRNSDDVTHIMDLESGDWLRP